MEDFRLCLCCVFYFGANSERESISREYYSEISYTLYFDSNKSHPERYSIIADIKWTGNNACACVLGADQKDRSAWITLIRHARTRLISARQRGHTLAFWILKESFLVMFCTVDNPGLLDLHGMIGNIKFIIAIVGYKSFRSKWNTHWFNSVHQTDKIRWIIFNRRLHCS